MRQQLFHQFWIVLAAAVIFFTTLGATGLWDEDEPLYACCAREMLQRGDWVVPTFNGELFPDKPPLMFWTMMSGFGLFGVNEFGARFFSAVLGIGTAIATYHLGRLLFRAEVGFWAGLVVASSIIFTISARAATVDAALVFVTTLAILSFVAGGIAKHRDRHRFLPDAWGCFALMWACMAVAVLAKGPIGLLLPAASIGLFLMIMNDGRLAQQRLPASSDGWRSKAVALLRPFGPLNFLRSFLQMRPLTGILVVAAVAGPWYVMVGLRTDGLWLEQFFAKFNLRPFTEPILGHSGPFYYHVPAILIGFFPWSIFIVPTGIDLLRRIRDHHQWRPGCILISCWLAVFFVFWSICSTKLPHYLLPAYPALALMTACFIDGWITQPERVNRWWLRVALGISVLVGIAFLIAFPIVSSFFLPGVGVLGLVGIALIVGGGLCLYWLERDRRRRVMTVYATTSVVFLTAVFGLAILRIDRYQHARPLIAELDAACPQRPQLAAYRFIRESIVFYAGHPIPCYSDTESLRNSLRNSKNTCIITSDAYHAEIERDFPGEYQVLIRRPRFLHSGEVLVLAPQGDRDVLHTAERQSGKSGPEQHR